MGREYILTKKILIYYSIRQPKEEGTYEGNYLGDLIWGIIIIHLLNIVGTFLHASRILGITGLAGRLYIKDKE